MDQSIPRDDDPGSLYAKSVFFRQFNDIDFYVEDADQENLYFTILKKLFSTVKIGNIFPLGGKQNLIQRAIREAEDRRISVYIADKDFDDILNTTQIVKGVFYLDRYCIENFLLEESAVVEYIKSEHPRLKAEAIRQKMNYGNELRDILNSLSDIFAVFLLIQFHQLHYKCTSLKPEKLCNETDNTRPDKHAIENYFRFVAKRLSESTNLKLHQEIEKFKSHFDVNDLTARNLSGEYVIWYLMHRIKKYFNSDSHPSLDSVRYRLAQYCTFESLENLKNSINTYITDRTTRAIEPK